MYVYVLDSIQRDINIRENVVTNFQKGGIVVRGPIKSKIHRNTITHWGETGIIAGNGLQVDGGTSSITSNIISGSKYYDATHTVWASAAMLLMAQTDGADNFRVIRNSVSNSDVGIWVIDYGAGLTNSKVINNTFGGNLWDGPYGPADMKAQANKYEE